MVLQKFTYRGVTLVEDSGAAGTPVTDVTGDGGDVVLAGLTAFANRTGPYVVTTRDPEDNDDDSDSASIGQNLYARSRWFNSTKNTLFECSDASTGAAKWHTIPTFEVGSATANDACVATNNANTDGAALNARGDFALDLQRSHAAATNVASGKYSVILSTGENTASGYYSIITNGWGSSATDTHSFTHGASTTCSSAHGFVGGKSSSCLSDYSFAHGNSITSGVSDASGKYSFASGASYFTQAATGNYSFVCGSSDNGIANSVSGYYSLCIGYNNATVSGNYSLSLGSYNTTTGHRATSIGYKCSSTQDGAISMGGGYNVSSGYYSFAAGWYNVIYDNYSVSFGRNNEISAKYCQSFGGYSGISSNYSTITGRNHDSVSQLYCFVTGKNGKPSNDGQFVMSVGTDDGQHQSSFVTLRVSTTDGSLGNMIKVNSVADLDVSTGLTWFFIAEVIARRTDSSETGCYVLEGVIANVSGTTAIKGSVTKSVIYEDDSSWDVNAIANDTTDQLEIQVTGAASKSINWTAFVRLTEATGQAFA